MKKHSSASVVLALALAAVVSSTVGCSGSPRSPLSPTYTPAPAPASAYLIALSIIGRSELTMEEPLQLAAIASDQEGNTVDVTADAQWSSSDDSVATVSNGFVTPVASGEATISAAYQSLYSDFKVSVRLRQQEDGSFTLR